ncbi:MAG: hypothetical protein ACOCQ6_01545, partial [Bacteroidota bacterium]
AFVGIWDSSLLFWLVLASIVVGFLVYWIGSLKNMRQVEPFVGGEKANEEKGFPVTGFYHTLRQSRYLAFFYVRAEEKWFDIYDLMKGFVLWTNKGFSAIHTGVLTTYVFWIYGGLVIILLLLML